MKSTELHRMLINNGWQFKKQKGTSHCHYEKDGKKLVVPYHGAKEVPTGLCNRILKDAGIK